MGVGSGHSWLGSCPSAWAAFTFLRSWVTPVSPSGLLFSHKIPPVMFFPSSKLGWPKWRLLYWLLFKLILIPSKQNSSQIRHAPYQWHYLSLSVSYPLQIWKKIYIPLDICPRKTLKRNSSKSWGKKALGYPLKRILQKTSTEEAFCPTDHQQILSRWLGS